MIMSKALSLTQASMSIQSWEPMILIRHIPSTSQNHILTMLLNKQETIGKVGLAKMQQSNIEDSDIIKQSFRLLTIEESPRFRI